ncbi:hypothetical protein TTHERM_01013320 (macronuclear) [Tetrahymena thermophila SB210]|uniref:Uncharacterized protein n=1 Tax=Tetrahymena thermophila (strain SB210) TaxID=312017 RepID=Q22L21_TETTS|nr:hypothetical protein TTHERM_01013320 [Tetrahymena thermophila SB210]EAR85996.2 hypothetical protein TTHERM_01013320 [Tetrahymena thermophila SB210]|eukprot:XP_976591.2 hypothetical protein TTHERM_01013320 [Tetrahymena thermophila SB210]
MDDIDDLLATLTNTNNTKAQPNKSPFEYGNKNNKNSSADLDEDDDILGGYNPSGISNNKANDKKANSSSGFGMSSKPSTAGGKQGQYDFDDVLKLIEDDKNDKGFGKSNANSSFGIKMQNNQSSKQQSTFFDDFDIDLDDNKNTGYAKSGYIPSSNLDLKKTQTAVKKDDDDYLEKRASLFGVPLNSKINSNTAPAGNKQNMGGDNFSVGSSRDLFKEKDYSPFEKDNFDDFKKKDYSKQQQGNQPTFPSANKLGNDRSKSMLDEDDDFLNIDNFHSRRGRSSTRKISQNIQQKDDKSNSPLAAPSSAKRSVFDENPSKTANQLDDDNDLGGYNPTLSRLPSRNRGLNREKSADNNNQKPPRLLKTHDEFENPQKPSQTQNNLFSDKNLFEDNNNKSTNNIFADKNDMFGDTTTGGGRNANRFGNTNNLYRDRNDFGDYTNQNNLNNKQDEPIISNNRMASAQIQLKTDKSSILDSLEKPGDSHFMLQKPNTQQQVFRNQSELSNTQPKLFSEATTKQITYNTTQRQPAQPQIVRVQESFNQEESFRHTEVFNKETNSQDFFKNTKVFEDTKKQIQEETMYQITMIRNNYEGQIQLMRQNHEEQLQHEKKMRENIVEEMQNLLKSEKERLKMLHESELKSKEATWDYEKQQMQRTFQQESEMLKKQIEQQQKMISLAEEIRLNADKLNNLTNKYDNQNEVKRSQDDDLREREEKLLLQEKKIRVEQDYLENERIRLNKMREDLDSRESLLRQEIDAEKVLLKREYNRLQELQDQISSQEQDKKRQLIIERQELINEKSVTQDERLKIKEEYEQKYRDFEMQIVLFEKQRQANEAQITKLEALHKSKIRENEEIRQKLIDQEENLLKRQKVLELKEIEFSRKEMDFKKISSVSYNERSELEAEQKKLFEIQKKIQEEQSSILEFRQTFMHEKEKLDRQQHELFLKEKKIQQDVRHIETEKRDLQMMQRTIQSLKSDAIKEFDNKKLSVLNASLISQAYEDNSFLTRKENVNTSNINYNIPSMQHARSSSLHNNKHRRDNSLNEVLTNNFVQTRHNETQQVFKKPPLNQTHNRVFSNNENNPYKITVNNQEHKAGASNSMQPFNLNEFMTQLKVIDQNSNFNQAYINKERENLFIKEQFGSEYLNSHLNKASGSYTQSNFQDSSPYIYKPSNSSVESHQ